MLRFLLDEHISPTVAEQVSQKQLEIPIVAVGTWENGAHLGADDATLLTLAHQQDLTLVTYDQRTIAPLLKSWAQQSVAHGGVIFVDERTIPSHDFGGLVRSLIQLWTAQAEMEWTNAVVYLTRTR
jgi:Domain of unknown function (DUF5615)